MIHLFSYPFVQTPFSRPLSSPESIPTSASMSLARGVIFVDISMAQAAAFGSVLALTLGWG